MALGVSGLFQDARDVPQVYGISRSTNEPKCRGDEQRPAAKEGERNKDRDRERAEGHDNLTCGNVLASIRAGLAVLATANP